MAFIAGPRQVGKTTSSRQFTSGHYYLNWDNEDHRSIIVRGPGAVAEYIGLPDKDVIVFDEIHKYPLWKSFLKGFYDTYGPGVRIVVTGSARLDIYRKGGDSLMGRYFLYRMHPLSVAELLSSSVPDSEISLPAELAQEKWLKLLQYGGFPQPFLRANNRFYNQWKRTRNSQIFREDIHDIARVHEVGQVEVLAELVRQQAGQLTSIASLARKVRAAENSVRSWLKIMEALYYCFPVRPWSNNIARSLRKEPKFYLWDWGVVDQAGFRNENMIASHLHKAVHWWTDNGYGDFGLFYLRTKDKREVDFVVTRDNKPWFLVEVKTGNTPLSPALEYFQKKTAADHAFQVVIDAPYRDADCFKVGHPVIVPALTLLSQLV